MIHAYTIVVKRGQTKPLLFTVRYPAADLQNRGGQPIDLTGATAYLRVRPDIKAAPVILLDSAGNGIVIQIQAGATKGMLVATITPTMTSGLVIGDDYIFDAWVVLATGEKYPIIETSRMILEAEVTTVP